MNFHNLHEAKEYVNAKTPYTLASLTEGFLKKMRDNPQVPPSMKERLTSALQIKSNGVKGGLAGVSKASGFIQRMMANNKLANSGQYKNSKKMNKKPNGKSLMSGRDKGVFNYKKLANEPQHGNNRNPNHDYGASPFIQKYFYPEDADIRRPPNGRSNPETATQREARLKFMARRLAKVAAKLAAVGQSEEPVAEEVAEAQEAVAEELKNHFGNKTEAKEEEEKAPQKEDERPKEEENTVWEKVWNVKEHKWDFVRKVKVKREPIKVSEKTKAEFAKAKKEEEEENRAEKARIEKEQKADTLTKKRDLDFLNDVLNNKVWVQFFGWYDKWTKKHERELDSEFREKWYWGIFGTQNYEWHDGFFANYTAGWDVYSPHYHGKSMNLHKDFLKDFLGFSDSEIEVSTHLWKYRDKAHETEPYNWVIPRLGLEAAKRLEACREQMVVFAKAFSFAVAGIMTTQGWEIKVSEKKDRKGWKNDNPGQRIFLIPREGEADDDKGYDLTPIWSLTLRSWEGRVWASVGEIKKVDGVWVRRDKIENDMEFGAGFTRQPVPTPIAQRELDYAVKHHYNSKDQHWWDLKPSSEEDMGVYEFLKSAKVPNFTLE